MSNYASDLEVKRMESQREVFVYSRTQSGLVRQQVHENTDHTDPGVRN